MKILLEKPKGYIALIAILIITSVTLAIGISINLLSINETKIGLMQEQTTASFFTADGCLEEAILRIKREPTKYLGGELNLGDGSCSITVMARVTSCNITGKDSNNYRTIYIKSNVNNLIRNIIAEVNLTGGKFTLDCWKEAYHNYVIIP